jgi:hypothetical protein
VSKWAKAKPHVLLALGVLLDVALVIAVLRVRVSAWYRGQNDPPVAGLDDVSDAWWAWGGPHDFLLYGPDAGNWAANARALMEGLPPDANRMPVYGYLTWAMTWFADDVVFAGHLVNHLSSAATCAVAYALGRATSGRAAGLGAAFLVAVSVDLVDAQNLYGVDPSFNLVVAGLLLAGWWSIRGPWWVAPITGVLMGVTAASHYLGLLFPIPVALCMLLADGDWKRRVLPPVGALVLGFVAFKLLMWPYDDYTLGHAVSVYSQGVLGATSQDQSGGGFTEAVQAVWTKLASAPRLAIQMNLGALRSDWVPWAALVPLFWLGLAGVGLPGVQRGPKAKVVRGVPWDWRVGIYILVLMLPLVLLEAARAPERYRFYARPLVALCVVRGLSSVLTLGDHAVRRWLWVRWPVGWVSLGVVGLLCVLSVGHYRSAWSGAPPAEGVHERQVGLAVSAAFEGTGGIATSSQAIGFYAGREVCPRSFCPRPAQAELRQCRSLHRQWCAGTGDLPYVVDHKPNATAADQPNADMDAWIEAQFEPLQTIRTGERVTRIYAVPRSAL